jgi:hypothetical protein
VGDVGGRCRKVDFERVPAGLDWFSMDVYKFCLPNHFGDAAAWTLTEEVYTAHICAPRPQDLILCCSRALTPICMWAPGSPQDPLLKC